jgi:hypothetical protein
MSTVHRKRTNFGTTPLPRLFTSICTMDTHVATCLGAWIMLLCDKCNRFCSVRRYIADLLIIHREMSEKPELWTRIYKAATT